MEPLALEDPELARVEELAESEGQVLDALNALPPDQRLAVEGRVVQERDYAELARRLSCSESVVRKRVSRGLHTMRTSLGRGPGDGRDHVSYLPGLRAALVEAAERAAVPAQTEIPSRVSPAGTRSDTAACSRSPAPPCVSRP